MRDKREERTTDRQQPTIRDSKLRLEKRRTNLRGICHFSNFKLEKNYKIFKLRK